MYKYYEYMKYHTSLTYYIEYENIANRYFIIIIIIIMITPETAKEIRPNGIE